MASLDELDINEVARTEVGLVNVFVRRKFAFTLSEVLC